MSIWSRAIWRFVWATGLGPTYARTLCRLNLYNKFPNGRCHYCGEANHGLHWRFAPPPVVPPELLKPRIREYPLT